MQTALEKEGPAAAIAAAHQALASLRAAAASLRVAAGSIKTNDHCGRIQSILFDSVDPAVRDLTSVLAEVSHTEPQPARSPVC